MATQTTIKAWRGEHPDQTETARWYSTEPTTRGFGVLVAYELTYSDAIEIDCETDERFLDAWGADGTELVEQILADENADVLVLRGYEGDPDDLQLFVRPESGYCEVTRIS